MRHGKKLLHLQGHNKGAKSRQLRNLVGALLHHESIITTFARARYTARAAEKVISKGKRGTNGQAMKAMSFLLPPHHHSVESLDNGRTRVPTAIFGYPEIEDPYNAYANPETFEPPKSLMSKVFMTLADRYKDREGGYTRILKTGRRPGDKAKMAVVCLVDGPRDVRFEMLAREVGTQAVQHPDLAESGVLEGTTETWAPKLHSKTQKELHQVLKMRSAEEKREFEEKAKRWADQVLAQATVSNGLRRIKPELHTEPVNVQRRTKEPYVGYKVKAGERLSGVNPGETGLGLARGLLRGPGQVMGRFRRTPPQVVEQKFLVKAGSAKMASVNE